MNNSQKLLIQKNIENYSFKNVNNDSSQTIFFWKLSSTPTLEWTNIEGWMRSWDPYIIYDILYMLVEGQLCNT